jgi:predicted transcriptional regulator
MIYLTEKQQEILDLVKNNKGISATELAKKYGKNPIHYQTVLLRLEQLGYISIPLSRSGRKQFTNLTIK